MRIVYYVTIFLTVIFINNQCFSQKKTDEKEIKLQTSAHTEMCKAKIEKTLAYEKGVISSELDRETQILTVKFNQKKTDENKIIKVISNLGHEAILIKDTEQLNEKKKAQ